MDYEIKISFILLTWNSENYIKPCIDSIVEKCRQENISYEALIADNNSSDGTKEILKSYASEKIKPIYLQKNYGTTYARNLAIKKSSGNIICIIDSDTVIKNGNLKDLCNELISSKKIGIIAPRLITKDGVTINSIKRFPSLMHKIVKLKKLFIGSGPLYNEFYQKIPDRKVTVDNAISACWFLTKEVIASVGFLDEKIFYSPEDMDYCLRVWKSGRNILYYPSFVVLHYVQQLSYKKGFNIFFIIHGIYLLYYFIKHRYLFKSPRYGEWEKTQGCG